jgi:hypothetical protein
MKSVKIPLAEYKALRALAKERGCFLTKVLTDAVRAYLAKPK